MTRRKYLFPNVIELNLAAGRPLGVNVYLIDGGGEYVLLDVGMLSALDEIVDLIRAMDFPLSKCKMILATHADVDHVQGLASARDRLRTKTAAHPKAAALIESGEAVQTYARITAQGVDLPMPACKIDKKLKDGDRVTVGELTLDVLHTPGHTPGQLSFRLGRLLFSGDNIYQDGGVGAIDAHHGSHVPDFIASLTRLRDADADFLLPSHGPPFRHHKPLIQSAIDRLTGYQFMSDFGTCAVRWPLEEQWKADILAGKMPTFDGENSGRG